MERRPPHLLIVCTANICRSPMASSLLVRRLRGHEIVAKVRSCASTPAVVDGPVVEGRPADAVSIAALGELGLDLTPHRSRGASRGLVVGADLVITMECRHVVDIAGIDLDAWPRTFALRPLVERAESIDARAPGEELSDWMARLHEGRTLAQLLELGPGADVADPSGGSLRAMRTAAAELDRLLDRFVRRAFPGGTLDTVPSSGRRSNEASARAGRRPTAR